MPGLRDILERFRPVAAPGAPSQVGVPADWQQLGRDELAAVFALVDEIDASCAAIRADGRQHADEIRHAGELQAQQILAEGRARADKERIAVLDRVRADAGHDRAVRVATARQDAGRIEAAGIAALDPYVEAAVALIRAVAEHARTETARP